MLPVFYLERKIFLIIFSEIHSLDPRGDTLAGIIFETYTALVVCAESLLGAKDGTFVQIGAVDAVGAGTFDFLSKQH